MSRDGAGQHAVVDATPSSYMGHRFPVEIISQCVWLYHRFPLSLRDAQETMAEGVVTVSYESVHQWCRKFGQNSPTDCAAGGHVPGTSGV